MRRSPDSSPEAMKIKSDQSYTSKVIENRMAEIFKKHNVSDYSFSNAKSQESGTKDSQVESRASGAKSNKAAAAERVSEGSPAAGRSAGVSVPEHLKREREERQTRTRKEKPKKVQDSPDSKALKDEITGGRYSLAWDELSSATSGKKPSAAEVALKYRMKEEREVEEAAGKWKAVTTFRDECKHATSLPSTSDVNVGKNSLSTRSSSRSPAGDRDPFAVSI
ncbi:hypothetical protein GUITHDRAFT_118023 [Guillardia theta CCMP2712]|uniref:Uncharacterized protein n=1 Tax=Guillardia theta (strain CCMP2712) TaxID=905079 RepID=L1IJ83_GUITC|nr:hypothetical protein GUITHDRAFT_118023 [Guillardia theta CCMP2712]EKX35875.1 hypothetical protein GUITHDRAFT_118023 [Guillardia theta CCMP2712]|eukprot:XP_005822855.1 hypothetical protein GUITHDRAFT_118023 [Guillardia theta CCMP2712]